MLYSFPDYYKEFSCVADQCEDTCCAGWQIVIDPVSLSKYKRVKGPYRWKLWKSIHWIDGTFRQNRERRCAFLNESNLCDLYTNLGKGSLCKTCRNYPRHIEEFENVREITLSLSCPEVARILLSKKEKVHFVQYEDKKQEEYEDFDLLFFSELLEARKRILTILQDRSLAVSVRAGLMYGICHDMQRRIDRQELFSCEEVYTKYEKTSSREYVKKQTDSYLRDYTLRYDTACHLMEEFTGLERLKKEWDVLLMETKSILYSRNTAYYEEICRTFEVWTGENPMWEIWMEQLLVYFVSTYLCGAVYDGNVFAKAHMAFVSLAFLYELCMARWVRNEQTFDALDLADIIYRYAREVEHSDPNLDLLERMRFDIRK